MLNLKMDVSLLIYDLIMDHKNDLIIANLKIEIQNILIM